MFKQLRRAICLLLVISFFASSLDLPQAKAGEMTVPLMPSPGIMVALSPAYMPAQLKGIVIHAEDPFKFDFIVDKGQGHLDTVEKNKEYSQLIKYFLASMTVPDQDQWVNLSPYEKNRIIEADFGQTAMGRDLLSQDYLLKEISSSLIYPESRLGRAFWQRVYARAARQLGTTNIPVTTFNKVWIVPDQAQIDETNNAAYITKSHLKVMLEQDYLAIEKNKMPTRGLVQKNLSPSPLPSELGLNAKAPQVNHLKPNDNTSALSSQAIKEIILPELEKEVNMGKNFAPLRQVFSGMILAAWYKHALKQSILGQIYADKSKTQGLRQPGDMFKSELQRTCPLAGCLAVNPLELKASQVNHLVPSDNDIEFIYQRYLTAFKKGVFNYIKDADSPDGSVVPRKYFAGGFWNNIPQISNYRTVSSQDMAMTIKGGGDQDDVLVKLASSSDEAMAARSLEELIGANLDKRDERIPALEFPQADGSYVQMSAPKLFDDEDAIFTGMMDRAKENNVSYIVPVDKLPFYIRLLLGRNFSVGNNSVLEDMQRHLKWLVFAPDLMEYKFAKGAFKANAIPYYILNKPQAGMLHLPEGTVVMKLDYITPSMFSNYVKTMVHAVRSSLNRPHFGYNELAMPKLGVILKTPSVLGDYLRSTGDEAKLNEFLGKLLSKFRNWRGSPERYEELLSKLDMEHINPKQEFWPWDQEVMSTAIGLLREEVAKKLLKPLSVTGSAPAQVVQHALPEGQISPGAVDSSVSRPSWGARVVRSIKRRVKGLFLAGIIWASGYSLELPAQPNRITGKDEGAPKNPNDAAMASQGLRIPGSYAVDEPEDIGHIIELMNNDGSYIRMSRVEAYPSQADSLSTMSFYSRRWMDAAAYRVEIDLLPSNIKEAFKRLVIELYPGMKINFLDILRKYFWKGIIFTPYMVQYSKDGVESRPTYLILNQYQAGALRVPEGTLVMRFPNLDRDGDLSYLKKIVSASIVSMMRTRIRRGDLFLEQALDKEILKLMVGIWEHIFLVANGQKHSSNKDFNYYKEFIMDHPKYVAQYMDYFKSNFIRDFAMSSGEGEAIERDALRDNHIFFETHADGSYVEMLPPVPYHVQADSLASLLSQAKANKEALLVQVTSLPQRVKAALDNFKIDLGYGKQISYLDILQHYFPKGIIFTPFIEAYSFNDQFKNQYVPAFRILNKFQAALFTDDNGRTMGLPEGTIVMYLPAVKPNVELAYVATLVVASMMSLIENHLKSDGMALNESLEKNFGKIEGKMAAANLVDTGKNMFLKDNDFIEMQNVEIERYKIEDFMEVFRESFDRAMVSREPGGIDMNRAHLDMRIKRNGQGVVLPIGQQDLAQLSQIKGLIPVIIAIRPVAGLLGSGVIK